MKRHLLLYGVIGTIVWLVAISGNTFYASNVQLIPNNGPTPSPIPRYTALLVKAKQEGSVQVTVEFSVPFRSFWALFGERAEQGMIDATRRQILEELSQYKTKVYSDDDWPIPVIWLELDEPALRHLIANPLIIAVEENVGFPLNSAGPRPTDLPTATK